MTSLHQPFRRNIHLGKREQFLPQILQGGADVVNGIVDNEEAVVEAGRFRHSDGRILLVVPCQVGSKALCDLPGDDLGSYASVPFRQQQQYGFVHIVVNQCDAVLGGTYQFRGEDVGIEDLSVEEDALHGR